MPVARRRGTVFVRHAAYCVHPFCPGMSKARQTATVRVRVVVEVTLNSHWGADATVGEVHKVGTREAVDHVRGRLVNATGVRVLDAVTSEVVVRSEDAR